MSSASALVLGANGQDGVFLTRHLLRRGYRVIGVGRQSTPRIGIEGLFSYRQADLSKAGELTPILQAEAPDLVFHTAAVHGSSAFSSGAFYETVFADMLAVNVGSAHAALEYFRTTKPDGALVYASSGKVFGPAYPELVDETSPKRSDCLYTVTKLSAENLIAYYRRTHGAKASIYYPFAHESELRPADYFIPKLVKALAGARSGSHERVSFHTLDFLSDWGSASEYMDIVVDIAERGIGNDFVLASGKTWVGRELAQQVFERHGLDYRDSIAEERPPSPVTPSYRVSTAHLQSRIGRVPETDFVRFVGELALGEPAQAPGDTPQPAPIGLQGRPGRDVSRT